MAIRKQSETIPLERVTGAVPVINSDHEAVHLGWGYAASVYAEAVADDGLIYIEFKTPVKESGTVHLKAYRTWTEGGLASFTITEAPVLTTGSTTLTPHNRLRTSVAPQKSRSILKSDPTSISGGTAIEGPFAFGGGGVGTGAGGGISSDQELVLGHSTTYLLAVKNLAGAAKALGLWIFWYEEN
jgi:hypothetical protein